MDRIAKYRRDLLMAADQTTTDPHWPVFINKLEAAELQFAQGRPAAFKALWSRGDDVSLYGAFGVVVSGWKEVVRRLIETARSRGINLMQLQEPPQGIMRQPAKGCSGDAAWYIPHRTLMRPPVVKG